MIDPDTFARLVVILVSMFVFLIVILADVFGDFTPDPYVYVIVGGVAGGAMGISIIRKNGGPK